MGTSVNLTFDLGDMPSGFEQQLATHKAKIRRATRRAITKTGRWLNVQAKRRTSSALSIAQKPLRNRFKLEIKHDKHTNQVNLWIGLLPIAISRLGNPQQKKHGVMAKSHFVRGAFIANIYDRESVWLRRSSKHNPHQSGEGRFPVDEQKVEIAADAVNEIRLLERELNKRFQVIFKQELNYEFNVK